MKTNIEELEEAVARLDSVLKRLRRLRYAVDEKLQDETQKDYDEFIDEMSLGGRTYREH